MAIKYDEIIAKNPDVDSAQLTDALTCLKELKDRGLISDTGYNLAPPYSGQPPQACDEGEKDPRVFKLHSHR